nr:MAG TPA: hypothetical protein [Inoviridae sp.]
MHKSLRNFYITYPRAFRKANNLGFCQGTRRRSAGTPQGSP